MGVTGGEKASIVAVRSWSVGGTRLPSEKVFSLPPADPGTGPIGLLGSDVLSHFRSIQVDYTKGLLILCA